MIRSMYTGVSGLRNHQLKMDVIGNNIANVNTTGFKYCRSNFADMYSQTLSGAAAPSSGGNLSGANPQQVGLGVAANSLDVLHTQGSAQVTDRTLDVCIQGEGFITVSNGSDLYYTRAGNLSGFLRLSGHTRRQLCPGHDAGLMA